MLPSITIYTTPDDLKYALFDQPEVISDVIRASGTWNQPIVDICDKVLAKAEHGSRVIDVGAGIGSFAIPLAVKYANHHIFSCFEPLPVLNLQLSTNVLLNNLSNVRVYQYGLANFEKTMDAPVLEVDNCGNHGSYSFNQEINRLRNMPSSQQNDVYEFRKLDSFNFAKIALIKISTPGMELEVLKGAREAIIINNFPPVMFESWSMDWYKSTKEDVLEIFKSLGYEHYCYMGEHIMAFKTQAQYNRIMSDDLPTEKVASFSVTEQFHETKSVLESQAPLR